VFVYREIKRSLSGKSYYIWTNVVPTSHAMFRGSQVVVDVDPTSASPPSTLLALYVSIWTISLCTASWYIYIAEFILQVNK
jgi:hypothetical protein